MQSAAKASETVTNCQKKKPESVHTKKDFVTMSFSLLAPSVKKAGESFKKDPKERK